tara:strand:- start:4927 stop:5076 length:150 start_codon:yes stop_codon:yes gene_type:complete
MIYNVGVGGYRCLYFNATKAFVVGGYFYIDEQRLIATNVTSKYLRGRVV